MLLMLQGSQISLLPFNLYKYALISLYINLLKMDIRGLFGSFVVILPSNSSKTQKYTKQHILASFEVLGYVFLSFFGQGLYFRIF
jgi:hypothetical protein